MLPQGEQPQDYPRRARGCPRRRPRPPRNIPAQDLSKAQNESRNALCLPQTHTGLGTPLLSWAMRRKRRLPPRRHRPEPPQAGQERLPSSWDQCHRGSGVQQAAAAEAVSTFLRGIGALSRGALACVIGLAENITLSEVLDLPDIAIEVVRNLYEQLMALHQWVGWYEDRFRRFAREDARVCLLPTIPGIGAVTAFATIASIGGGHQFHNGREFAAWLGLTPANKSGPAKKNWAGSQRWATSICGRFLSSA